MNFKRRKKRYAYDQIYPESDGGGDDENDAGGRVEDDDDINDCHVGIGRHMESSTCV